jgi:hypothetical protein
MAGLVQVEPGHPDAEGTAFRQKLAWRSPRALLIVITGTSPVMTSVGVSISSKHALVRCRVFLGELLFIGRLILCDLGLIGGEIAEARGIIRIAGLVNLVQVELARV